MSVKKDIQSLVDQMGEAIADGLAKDFDEYKAMVGERKGLKRALQIMDDQQGNGSIDDDDQENL